MRNRTASVSTPKTSTVLVILLVALGAACSEASENGSRLTGPEDPVVLAPPAFLPLSRPGTIYNGDPGIYDYSGTRDYHGGVVATRLVLYEDSTFTLQFASPRRGLFEFPGRYLREAYVVRLEFDGWSLWGGEPVPWLAIAFEEPTGDALEVRYNAVMQAVDFFDGRYVREARNR